MKTRTVPVKAGRSVKELADENRRLARELAEAREVLGAIRGGEVDAIVSLEADSVYAIHVAALAVDRAETYEESLQLLLRQLCLAGGWLYGEAWAATSDRQSLQRTRAWYGGSSDAIRLHENIVRLLFDESGQAGVLQALQERAPQWGHAEDLPPGGRATAISQSGFQTNAVVPVVVDGQVTAVLSLWKREREARNDAVLMRIAQVIEECGPLVQRKLDDQILRSTLSQLEAAVRERSREVADLSSRLQQEGTETPKALDRQETAFQRAQSPDMQSLVLHSVLDSMSCGVVVTDVAGRVLQFNAPAQEVLGDLSDSAPLRLWPDLYGLYCADRATRLYHGDLPLMKATQGKVTDRMEIFVRNGTRPEGIVLLMSARPLADDGGAPLGAVTVFEDVTQSRMLEERRALRRRAERDTLLREVHHRIKNNLASVGALLRQHVLNHPEFAKVVDQLEPQLAAIAAVHGLKAGDTTNVHLGPLIQSLTENANLLLGSKIQLTIADRLRVLQLQEEESVPLALVLNELLVNARKHGTGDLLALRADQDGDDVVIAVANNVLTDARLPDMNGSTGPGKGLALIHSLLPRGKATLRYERSGDQIVAVVRLASTVFGAPDQS